MGSNVFGGLYIVFFLVFTVSPLSHVWPSDQSRAPFPFLKGFYMLRHILYSHNVHMFDTVLAYVAVSQSSENSMHGLPGGHIRMRMVCVFLSVWTLTEMQVLCAGPEVRHYTQEYSVLLFEVEPLFFLLLIISVVLEKMQRINLVRKKSLSVDGSPSALCSSYRT